MRVTIGMKMTFVAAVGLMSLPWIVPVPADPPRTDSAITIVIEPAEPTNDGCPFA